ncbi:uncharacterized protein si:ch211-234p6.5 isoform X3 [Cololabis saira]|nr:uncharacterized protein si:ch211-234p6.5 isoform X3 [Cololabis saira]
MDDQDRVSQASSVATISYFPVTKQESDGKVQAFGKRCQAAKRDPNCPVVIRGWLNKKDSSGLKLWKRRWFVLSNYCLYYYKDSREESVLGSIPLPSYKILFCTPRECKNRKFTFKVVHQGMRAYFFSADTQEDMLGWVRALSQSAAMEPDSSMNRRCSSYQDFTQIGASSETEASEEGSPSQHHKHVSRTLSEPSHLSGGRMGRSHSEQRGRHSVHHRNRSPSNRTPSPVDLRRRAVAPHKEEDSLPGDDTSPQAGSLTSRGQLGSRPHTPVGRVDIRPLDDPAMMQQTLYYTPASPKLEFKSAPTTPVTERWQSLSKPAPIYGSVHHTPSGRRPLGKSHSTGADLLPPLPPSSRTAHAPHPPQHHHQRSHVSVCALPPPMASRPDPRELPPIRPLESDADAVLTRLCGCDKLLQSLSLELAQLQLDKDTVHSALEVSRMQVDEWRSQGPRAHEDALSQKALLQEELVTIRARMCDVSLEMEQVWSQYERMESELSVIRSHLQHICNFGLPQEQSQAQRELWMMEDILAGLRPNRDHICLLLGLQRHHMFQSPAPHPGSPGSPTERLQSGLPVSLQDMEQVPPIRPPLPLELQENHVSMDQGHGWTEALYEGIYNYGAECVHIRGSSQPDLLNVKAQRDASEPQYSSKWVPPDTTSQSTKRMKMSEEEQIERMKRNQERLTNKKKPPVPPQDAQSQNSEKREEPPFPLRVTRVVTAVLPSSLVARRVSVEDPPAELNTQLPEQIPSEMQQNMAEQSKKLLNKPARRLVLESPDLSRSSAEAHRDHPVKKSSRQQHHGGSKASRMDSLLEVNKQEGVDASSNQVQDLTGLGHGSEALHVMAEEQSSLLLTTEMDPDFSLSPEQRDAKLRRVERIRERVMRSAVRESATTDSQQPIKGQGKEAHQVPQRIKEGHDGSERCLDNLSSCAELQLSGATSEEKEGRQHVSKSKSQAKFGYRTQHSGRAGITKTKLKHQASPFHISSMTVYQEEGGKGFTGYNDDEQKHLERQAAGDTEKNAKSCDLKAKWFLSTDQWQEFIPLQIPNLDTPLNEKTADDDSQQHCSDDSNGMSSTVSESLEKMKENHSLFYKIACDISISDSDITKNDAPTSSRPEEEKALMVEATSIPSEQEDKDSSQQASTDKKSVTSEKRHKDVTVETQHSLNEFKNSVKLTSVQEEITPKDCGGNSRGSGEPLRGGDALTGAHLGDIDSHQRLDDCAEAKEEKREMKNSDPRKADQERSEEVKNCTSLTKVRNGNEQEQDNKQSNSLSRSAHQGGALIRSASFGKPRVTVIRTSL